MASNLTIEGETGEPMGGFSALTENPICSRDFQDHQFIKYDEN
jgi:hypothetical protein